MYITFLRFFHDRYLTYTIRICRTCVSAAFRLNSTINYVRSEDTTYLVCDMAFWCAAELACVVLVFCVPVIPKVFRETRLLSRILNSWRSWSTKRTKESSASAFVHGSEYQPPTYRKINEDGGSTSSIPLGMVGAPESHGNPSGAVKFPSRIVRTTHFEAAEEFENNVTTSHPQNYVVEWSNGKT